MLAKKSRKKKRINQNIGRTATTTIAVTNLQFLLPLLPFVGFLLPVSQQNDRRVAYENAKQLRLMVGFIHMGKGASDPEGACQPVSQSMLLLLLPLFAGPFCIWRDFYMKITNYWQQARDYFSCVGCAVVLYFFFFGHHRGRGWHMPKTAKIVSPIGGGGTCIWIQ